jgi:phage-related protein
VLEAKFGDGYSQRMSDGLNTIMETWSLSFQNRPISDINIIRAFLEGKNGVQAFSWDPPGQVAATSKSITGVVNASGKLRVTVSSHGFTNGTQVVITGVVGTGSVANTNNTWLIEGVTTNTFDLSGSSYTSGAYTSGGTVTVPTIKVICKEWDTSILFTQADLVNGFGSIDCTFERVYE